ncbi:MAG: tRNA (adenosine(37)-N6)-threonylcarbamoyltransferase complex dimerization subunit type 1 TsaB [bacterium]|nr:tRNA (adenosine(37)-N6)-threonylcarbamoyltransferase complex dimerization subunit type 1 TsaB [bacterium]
MFLFINTAENKKLTVALVCSPSLRGRTPSPTRRTDEAISSEEKDKIFVETHLGRKIQILDKIILKINQNHSEELLPAVEKILKRNKIALKDLAGVGVAAGPGSFTGVRVGVAAANALGFALDIPVIGIKCEKGKNLIKEVFRNFEAGKFSRPAMPVYKI